MLAYPQTSCGRVGGIHSACHPKKRGNINISLYTSFNFIMFGRTWVLGKWSQFYSVLERWAKNHNFILYWVLGLFKHPKVYVPRMQRHAQHEQSCHSTCFTRQSQERERERERAWPSDITGVCIIWQSDNVNKSKSGVAEGSVKH